MSDGGTPVPKIPATADVVRAVLCTRPDGPAALTLGLVPRPVPGPSQVRIAVHAAALNFADTLIVQGRYQLKPTLPFVPGLEVAGVVSETGAEVTQFRPGDRVMAALGIGAFAEEVVCNASATFLVPDGMDLVSAASVPIAYGSAYFALKRRARLRAGETVLVLGAAGGLGLAVVDVAKALGASVIAAASGPEKLALALAHGADRAVDYSADDLREKVLALTGGRGVDVVIDPVGGDLARSALRCLAWEGRIVVAGFASGQAPEFPANYLLVKNISAVGFFFGEYRSRDVPAVREAFEAMTGWIREGRLRPHVSRIFPASEAGAAMTWMQSRQATGKIVLAFRGA